MPWHHQIPPWNPDSSEPWAACTHGCQPANLLGFNSVVSSQVHFTCLCRAGTCNYSPRAPDGMCHSFSAQPKECALPWRQEDFVCTSSPVCTQNFHTLSSCFRIMGPSISRSDGHASNPCLAPAHPAASRPQTAQMSALPLSSCCIPWQLIEVKQWLYLTLSTASAIPLLPR